MPEIITFTRYFPEWHRKAGQRTWFVEKILKSLPDGAEKIIYQSMPEILNNSIFRSEEPKPYDQVRYPFQSR